MARVSRIKFTLVLFGFWPNPGPGRLPMDLARGDVGLANVFVCSVPDGQFRVRMHSRKQNF